MNLLLDESILDFNQYVFHMILIIDKNHHRYNKLKTIQISFHFRFVLILIKFEILGTIQESKNYKILVE